MAQEFSDPEKCFCTHQKWASLQALTLPKQSDFTELSDNSKAYIYIFWYGYSVLVNTACDTVCLWLRDKAHLFRCTSWWVLLVCSGVPAGGYCLSVQAYQLVGTACLFRRTSWWVLLVCSGVPVGGYCLSVQVYQLVGTACLFRCTSWWVLLVCSGVPVGGYCPSHGTSVIAQPCLLTYTS